MMQLNDDFVFGLTTCLPPFAPRTNVLVPSAVHVTTAECTGDQSIPVLKGVDFVAYWSLAGGQPAVYGSEQYSTVFQGYLFFFSSIQNKMIFEV